MGRLTKRTETGVAYMADPITLQSSLEDRGKVLRMVDRLAEYEDTGLEPGQIEACVGHNTALIEQLSDMEEELLFALKNIPHRCCSCKHNPDVEEYCNHCIHNDYNPDRFNEPDKWEWIKKHENH